MMKKIISKFLLLTFSIFILTTSSTTSAQDLTEESKTLQAPIKIGAIFAISGWAAIGGKPESDAVIMAVEDINNSGGLLGRKVELVLEDNTSDFKGTVTAFKRIFNVKKADVLIGPNWAEFSEIVAPLAQSSKNIMIGTSGYTKTLTTGRDYVFTVFPPHRYITNLLAKKIATSNYKKIAILASTAAYSLSLTENLSNQIKNYGGSTPEVFEFNLGETDFKAKLIKIKNLGYDCLVNMLISSDYTTALKQIQELQINLPLYSSNVAFYEETIAKDPSILPNDMILFNYKFKGSDLFNKRFLEKFKYPADIQSARAYSAVIAYKNAVEKCKTTLPTKVKICIKEITFEGLEGENKFTENNLIEPNVEVSELFKVNDSKFLPLDE